MRNVWPSVVPVGLADPELAYWTHSGNIVFMTILGGFNNFFGPIVGAFAFIGGTGLTVSSAWLITMA